MGWKWRVEEQVRPCGGQEVLLGMKGPLAQQCKGDTAGEGSVVACWPTMCEALGSYSCTTESMSLQDPVSSPSKDTLTKHIQWPVPVALGRLELAK